MSSADTPASPKPVAASASPKSPAPKRALEDDGAEKQASSKKSKKAAGGDGFNFNKALDKEHEGKSLSAIIKLPPSALQGLSSKADPMFAHFKINTIEDLGKWKFFQIARAIDDLAKTEEKNGRHAGALANINRALDKEHESKSFSSLLKENVSALQGLAEWSDDVLKPLGAGKIGQLATFKYCVWADALTKLAAFENADGSS